MSAPEWRERRRGWSAAPLADAYDRRRFGSVLGQRKHKNDVTRVLKTMARHLPPEVRGEGGLVLDLPCGTGRLGGALAAAGYAVVGADLSREMLCQAVATAGSPNGMLCAEAERLPFTDEAVDVVLSLRFLIHIQDASARRGILAEMARVTRHLVIGQVRDPRSLKYRSRRVRRALGASLDLREPSLTRPELVEELKASDLELVALVPLSRLFSDKSFFVARPLAVADGA